MFLSLYLTCIPHTHTGPLYCRRKTAMGDYHADCDARNKLILLDVAKDAPNEDIKRVVQMFDVDKDPGEIYKAINANLKPLLTETADYLKIDTTGLLKEVLVQRIISKLNSILLEYCRKCSNYFTVGLEEKPIVTCACGQPCHNTCYSDIKDIINNFPGIVYQCSQCNSQPEPATTTTKSSTIKIPEAEDSSKIESLLDTLKKSSKIESHVDTSKESTVQLRVVESFNLDLLQSLYPQSSSYRICEHYKRQNCPHGRDGKTEIEGEPCKYLHPKKCFAWCRAGKHDRHGCTKDKDCPFYHPIICRNSMRYRRCTKSDCTFAHLKFTKRYYSREQQRSRREPDHIQQIDHKPPTTQRAPPVPWVEQKENETNRVNNPPPAENNAKTHDDRAFLVNLLQSMRLDMQTQLQTQVQDMQKHIFSQVSQMQHQMWQPGQIMHTPQHVQIDQNAARNQIQHQHVNPTIQPQPQQVTYQRV